MAHLTARRRLALAAIALVVLAGATAPLAVAAVSTAYPVQGLGDRGTDVATIQQLLHVRRSGFPAEPGSRGVVVRGIDPPVVPIDGRFGASTAAGVRAFQASRDLPQTGIVDGPTWAALVVPLGPFAIGDAVVALQRQLQEKQGATMGLDGVYGSTTAAAVRDFQTHMGLSPTGLVDARTWRALVGHFELPHFSRSALCDNSTGNGRANWGTSEMISTLEAGGFTVVAAGLGRAVVNDVSHEHGGDIAGHETHEVGLDADLRPMRKANDQCASGTRWTSSAYDRAATRTLIKAIRAATPGHVKAIFFNDPVLIEEGLTVSYAGHDDHLHVRLCEAAHPDSRYRC